MRMYICRQIDLTVIKLSDNYKIEDMRYFTEFNFDFNNDK